MTSAVINNTKKIGIIDNELVLQNYKGVIENSKILETKKNRLLGELQSYRVEIQDHVKQIEQESDQARKEKLIKVFQLKNKDYEKRKSQVEQEIQAEDQRLTKEVLNQIDAYLHEYAEKNQFDLVYGVTNSGNLLFAKKEYDITKDLIIGLNKRYDGE